jgi:hypothetical protein
VTNEEAEALGRRALAAGWEWSDRQLSLSVLGEVDADGFDVDFPDFRDWATLGVLVGQVRERWGDPARCSTAWLKRDGSLEWSVSGTDGVDNGDFTTEAEAWVAALEASS